LTRTSAKMPRRRRPIIVETILVPNGEKRGAN